MHETCRKEGVIMPVNVNEIEPDEKIVEIEMERLREFRNHPFKVKADAQMLQLIESISKYGILNPLIVRPLPEGVYEIITGHRRKYAAQHLGFRKMPVIIFCFCIAEMEARYERGAKDFAFINLKQEEEVADTLADRFEMEIETAEELALTACRFHEMNLTEDDDDNLVFWDDDYLWFFNDGFVAGIKMLLDFSCV